MLRDGEQISGIAHTFDQIFEIAGKLYSIHVLSYNQISSGSNIVLDAVEALMNTINLICCTLLIPSFYVG